MKRKLTVGLLAIFLGGLGIHRFYLNQIILGIIYLLFCWTFISSIIGLIDGIIFLSMDENKFDLKYNKQMPSTLAKSVASLVTKQNKTEEQIPTPNSIQQPIVQVLELNAIEKLQFKKFISEQSGMNINDVENYFESINDLEKQELIKTFKVEIKSEVQRKTIQARKTQSVVPTIKEVQQNDHLPSCPKCKSNQVTFNKKGFSTGKAIVGGILTGGVGLLAGGIGKNKILLTCLKCGHTWTRG